MQPKSIRISIAATLAALPVLLLAYSSRPVVKRTGAPVDGGLDCSECHSSFGPANSDPAGSLKIDVSDYAPGSQQIVRVTVTHPLARRWGFQITARLVADETKMAGYFSSTDVVQVMCDPSGLAPCGDNLAFAGHTEAGTQPNRLASTVFDVPWTPPPTEMGALVFYASGVAADNDLSAAGDRVYTAKAVIHAQNLCNLSARPSIRTVVNGASFDNRLSANTLFSVLGANLTGPGLKRQVTFGDLVDGKFPTALGCIAVEIGGYRAPITYVQQDQINAQVPTQLNGSGPVSVTVIGNPGRPNEVRSDVASVGIAVQPTAPAFFLIGTSKYIAALGGTDYLGNPAVTPGTRAARPGEIIALYGTGFGMTNPVYQAGEIPRGMAPLPAGAVTVTIGGVTLAASDVLYAGLAPTLISGVYQFNVRVPQSVGPGDVVVQVNVGGQMTQADAVIRVAGQ